MSAFKVGDLCVVVDCIGWVANKYMIGRETTILGAPKMIQGAVHGEHLRYPCHDPVYPTTGPFWLRPENLRLKKPPAQDDSEPLTDFTPSSWDVGPFNPYKQKVTP